MWLFYIKKNTLIFIISIVASIFYCSWPIGYLLNSKVSKDSLASGLEAVSQPYNWLFIGSDIVSSLLACYVCYLLWKKIKSKAIDKYIIWSLISVSIFGVFTILDALIPEHCVPNFQVCPSFTQDHILLVHGFFSIIASLFLFFSLLIIWIKEIKHVLINIMLFGYIVFGAISLIEAIIPGDEGNWSQHYYITLCSAWLIIFPYAILLSVNRLKQRSESNI